MNEQIQVDCHSIDFFLWSIWHAMILDYIISMNGCHKQLEMPLNKL